MQAKRLDKKYTKYKFSDPAQAQEHSCEVIKHVHSKFKGQQGLEQLCRNTFTTPLRFELLMKFAMGTP